VVVVVAVALVLGAGGCAIDRSGQLAAADAGRVRDARVARQDAGAMQDGGVAQDGGGSDAGAVGFDAGLPLVADAGVDSPPGVDAGPYDVIDLECESGTVFGALEVIGDPAASAGAALVQRAGPADWFPDGSLPPSRVELPVTLRGGDYDVWVHLFTTNGSQDAFYAGFGPGPGELRRFFHRTYGTYRWMRGNDDMPRELFFPAMAPGSYTLSLGPGESEVRCDRVIVTNDPSFVPP
jgi:hypothetical protein